MIGKPCRFRMGRRRARKLSEGSVYSALILDRGRRFTQNLPWPETLRRNGEGATMKKITQCRACGSKALTPAFSLPASAVSRTQQPVRSNASHTDFVLCDPARDAFACGLVQSAAVAGGSCDAPSAAYATTRSHLRTAATEALELISGRDCAALDIGCNDGTLMSYYPRWVERCGVDPSERADSIGAWAWTARAPFPSEDVLRALGTKSFDIVTAMSVLEWIDAPRAFFAHVKSLLAEDGVFVLETLHAPLALTRTLVEAPLAGVAAIYSLRVLEKLARECDLKIFRGALTDKDGGSIRLFLTHAGAEDHDFDPWYEKLARLWDEENALALTWRQPYQAFEGRALKSREAFVGLLEELQARGERAHLLGAGAQSAALLFWAGPAANAFEAAVANGVEGALGSIPIISETDSRACEPDFLVAPAALKREMLERWRESILLGARMIVASPEPHVVHAQNYVAEYARAAVGGDGAGGVESLRAMLTAAGGLRLVAAAESGKAASA